MKNRFSGNIIKVICLICALALLSSLAACNGNEESSETIGEIYRIITFNTNGGSAVESIKVRDNQYAIRPEDPTLDNYVFRRWEREGREWLFESKRVTEDMTLSALWVSAVELFELDPVGDTGDLMITGFKKQASFSTLRIPSTINGKTIVALDDEAFSYTHGDYAKHIIIPETVVSVGDGAFMKSTEVTFDIQGVITSIGESSFENCSLLTEVKLGEGIESIPFMCFFECTSLKTINIPNGVTTIEENAFEGCSSMLTIVLPATLTTVEDSAFANCNALRTIFFSGTEEQFDTISISDSNEALKNANLYIYSETQPTNDGNYWHYEGGSPVIW
jgi:hypothetical protein